MADETFTSLPFRRRQFTGDNVEELSEFVGQDLRLNEDGSVTVQTRDTGGHALEDHPLLVGWWVRMYVDGAVNVASPLAANGDVPQAA